MWAVLSQHKTELVGGFVGFAAIFLLALWMTEAEDSGRRKSLGSFIWDFLGNLFNILRIVFEILYIFGGRSSSSSNSSFKGSGGSFGGGGASGSW